ncbi:MAG: dihydroorotate dehydrogenase electron transfer subunit [candidate division WOR-3 bacterium]
MIRERTRIIQHQHLTPEIYSLWLSAPKIAQHSKPGQFLQLQISETFDPFLARPFSIADVQTDKVRIIYRIRGKGTNMLKTKKVGEYLSVLGPLGKAIEKPKYKKITLIAGGIGIAPLLYLAKCLKDKYEINLFYGTRTKKDLILLDEFKLLCRKISLATEDGTKGHRGLVTDLLDSNKLSQTTVFTCGPKLMLKKVQNLLWQNSQIKVFGFLEEMLGCGCGLCFTCAVRKKESSEDYYHICTDGPVFDLSSIEL